MARRIGQKTGSIVSRDALYLLTAVLGVVLGVSGCVKSERKFPLGECNPEKTVCTRGLERDVNGDGTFNNDDIKLLIQYISSESPAPLPCPRAADVQYPRGILGRLDVEHLKNLLNTGQTTVGSEIDQCELPAPDAITPSSTVVWVDVNRDGDGNYQDVSILKAHLQNPNGGLLACPGAADYSGNGQLDQASVGSSIAILQGSLKAPDTAPKCTMVPPQPEPSGQPS